MGFCSPLPPNGVISMLSRLCVHINLPKSFPLLALGSLGSEAKHPVRLVVTQQDCTGALCPHQPPPSSHPSLPRCQELGSDWHSGRGPSPTELLCPLSQGQMGFVIIGAQVASRVGVELGAGMCWFVVTLGCCSDGESQHLASLKTKTVAYVG